jgi:hypothetical protein
MKNNSTKNKIIALSLALAIAPSVSYARDDVGSYSVADALSTEHAKNKLGSNVAFYFGDQAYSEPVKIIGEFSANKKTNAFNKSDIEACHWVFLSAMIALKGNAVVEIKSNYKNNLTSSNDTFQCGAGNIVAGVALTGKVVTL